MISNGGALLMKIRSNCMSAFLLFLGLSLIVGINGQLLGQGGTVVSKFGQAQVAGRNVIVHVTVIVPPGANANQVALDAIRNQGARPYQSDEYSTTGLIWDQFSPEADNPSVAQFYNSTNEPVDGFDSLQNSQVTWSAVSGSTFAISDAGSTPPDRPCPSLVR